MASLNNFQICDQDLTEELFQRYAASPELAIDTETLGLVPHRDRLCLIQICDTSGFVAAIRVSKGQTEAPLLKALMENPQITKVFHYARFDVAQLKHTFDIRTQPIFCTKIASKIARTYSSNHGLKTLVQEFLQVELDKSSQSSDWGNVSNLSVAQLNYAANDVRYLLALKQRLTEMLVREDRFDLAQRCFSCLPVIVALDLGLYGNVFEH